MVAPGSIKLFPHPLEPPPPKLRTRGGHHQSVAKGRRGPAFDVVPFLILAPHHERLFEQLRRQRLDKQGVHVSIDATALDQLFQPDEIGMMSVTERPYRGVGLAETLH